MNTKTPRRNRRRLKAESDLDLGIQLFRLRADAAKLAQRALGVESLRHVAACFLERMSDGCDPKHTPAELDEALDTLAWMRLGGTGGV